MASEGDRVLLRRVRRDPDAIGSLFRRHAAAIERFVSVETRDRSVASELTAETFAIALRRARSFHGRTDAEAVAWLYGIARNLVRHWHRHGRVERAARDRLGMPVRTWSDELDAVDERDEVVAITPQLQRAVRDLPAHQRAALELRVLCELPYAEIAERLGCSEPAARVRVSRALRTLKERLR